MPSPKPDARSLRSLLQYLISRRPETTDRWHGNQITPIRGGLNNLLYRVTNASADLVVKFAICDERNRAGREYAALLALRQAGLAIAPEPLLLDRNSHALPVVVQTWLEGDVSGTPPRADAEWVRNSDQGLACVDAHDRRKENTLESQRAEP